MRKTQKQIILEDLIAAGDRGVHGFSWVPKHILRYGARIYDLRKDGHKIRAEYEKGGKRYFLDRPERPKAIFDDKVNTVSFF